MKLFFLALVQACLAYCDSYLPSSIIKEQRLCYSSAWYKPVCVALTSFIRRHSAWPSAKVNANNMFYWSHDYALSLPSSSEFLFVNRDNLIAKQIQETELWLLKYTLSALVPRVQSIRKWSSVSSKWVNCFMHRAEIMCLYGSLGLLLLVWDRKGKGTISNWMLSLAKVDVKIVTSINLNKNRLSLL